jgi:hypothetical protein
VVFALLDAACNIARVWTRALDERLTVLRAADPSLSLFGASKHRYSSNPPLSALQVRAFEQQYNVTLPEEYSEYLRTLGNGGAGPAYGVIPLGHTVRGHDTVPWTEGVDFGALSSPFPFSRAWNLTDDVWEEAPSEAATEAAARELEARGVRLSRERVGRSLKNPFTGQSSSIDLGGLVAEGYYSPALLNGAVPLSDEGCNLRCYLVITGPERGHVWRDLRADNEGIVPAASVGSSHLTFRQWYERWLDVCSAKLAARAQRSDH